MVNKPQPISFTFKNVQYTNNIDSEDWLRIFAVKWSDPALRLLAKIFRQGNTPLTRKDLECFEYKEKGWIVAPYQVSEHLNSRFRAHRLPYRFRATTAQSYSQVSQERMTLLKIDS